MSGPRPRVLFLRGSVEDYLSDSLFHGLRSVLGADCVDYPKAETLYSSFPPERRRGLYGRGFTLYGLLPEIDVDRVRVWDRAREGEFDLVVFADIWREFGTYVALAPDLPPDRVAVLDGADSPHLYPYSGRWLARREWRFLPRAHTRHRYYKRELSEESLRSRLFRALPPRIARRLPPPRNVRPIAFSIPEEHLVAAPRAERARDLATHIVDPEVRVRAGRAEGYSFERQEDYYEDLRSSRFSVTTKRDGWDCMRHYEIAAAGCVPAFRDLDRKPATAAPHGLGPGNCITYRDADGLFSTIARVGPDEHARLAAGALAWARDNTTVARARAFLADLERPG